MQNLLLDDELLAVLLRCYFNDDKSSVDKIIDFTVLEKAAGPFLQHFKNEDEIHCTNHCEIITKIFQNNNLAIKNCSQLLGISQRTLIRYKSKYLQMFKSYLIQVFDIEQCS